jgi:ppGpp synthetase/RelA/SpoT-type nucleotidyltranferase
MPLSDETIISAVKRYSREFDCYEKLSKFVANKCEREIVRANTLRAGVTSRAKAPIKLQGKLQRKYRLESGLNTVDQALDRVSDLAGVRISTYLEADRDRVVQEIMKLFDGPNGSGVEVQKKDNPGKFYRATHCQVVLKKDDIDEPNSNLEGLSCEIQVCSLLAHVWNELEHDLVYKPTTGTLSDRENESLIILGNLTLSGDVVIKQLFDANAERVKYAQKDQEVIQDVFVFVTRMRDEFPDCKEFGRNAGQLFEDLVELKYDTLAKIRDKLLTNGYIEKSTKLLAEFKLYLSQHDDDTVQVELDSSDALLVLLLDVGPKMVLDLHQTGRGMGRPPRIYSFAHRFKQMKDQLQSGNSGIVTPNA